MAETEHATRRPKEQQQATLWQRIREGRSYIFTVLLVVLFLFIGLIIYLLEYWPMQFLYMMF